MQITAWSLSCTHRQFRYILQFKQVCKSQSLQLGHSESLGCAPASTGLQTFGACLCKGRLNADHLLQFHLVVPYNQNRKSWYACVLRDYALFEDSCVREPLAASWQLSQYRLARFLILGSSHFAMFQVLVEYMPGQLWDMIIMGYVHSKYWSLALKGVEICRCQIKIFRKVLHYLSNELIRRQSAGLMQFEITSTWDSARFARFVRLTGGMIQNSLTLYSSSAKSDMPWLFSIQGFQTTASGNALFSILIRRPAPVSSTCLNCMTELHGNRLCKASGWGYSSYWSESPIWLLESLKRLLLWMQMISDRKILSRP